MSCGNQLAGDPDFGQRKYCRIAYVCAGGRVQVLQIQEGERSTLSCPANVAPGVARQTPPRSVNGAAASPSSYTASSGTSPVDRGNRAAFDTATSSPGGAGSSDAVALARIVQALGGDAQSMSYDLFAALQMRMIAPSDPNWNRSNPRWVALFKTVRQDLRRDLEPALQVSMATGVRELAGTLESHVTPADVRELLAFYRSDKGQRYVAFQQRLGAIQTQAITQLSAALLGAGANPPPSDAPSEDRLEARRHLLANSWTSLVAGAMSPEAGSPQSTQQPDTKTFSSAMLDVVAKTHGPEVDALEKDYAKDLPQFEAFHQSSATKSLLSAMKMGSQQARASPQSSNPLKAALEHSVALHTPSWKSAYEAGRSSSGSPEAKSGQQNFAPIVAASQVAAALEAQKPGVLKPGDADYPQEVVKPTHVVALVVSGRDGADMRFNAEYVSDVNLCGHQVGLGGYFAYSLAFPIVMTRSADAYRGSISVDRFHSGKCGWRFSGVGYGMAGGVQNVLAIPADQGDSAMPQREFWCYRVAYENKPLHECEQLALLRWSNAMRAVSPEFLSQFTHQQQSDSHPIKITTQTKEIRVLLHDLNTIPGALIPVGDRDAQIARAKADQEAVARTPEYKAYMCVQEDNLEYVKSHKPVGDAATQRAALATIKQNCRVKFGLAPEDGN